MKHWIDQLRQTWLQKNKAVLITVVGLRGSAPRESGAKMIVSLQHLEGTIGGGQLEFQCIQIARELLHAPSFQEKTAFIRTFPLGTNCGQCCGGVVKLIFEPISSSGSSWLDDLFERYDAKIPFVIATVLSGSCIGKKILMTKSSEHDSSLGRHGQNFLSSGSVADIVRIKAKTGDPVESKIDYFLDPVVPSGFDIAVFGAGHVGLAVVNVLSRLDCDIRWIDSRPAMFPEYEIPQVVKVPSHDPITEIAHLTPGSYCLVMTHSHALDFEICDQVLRRGNFSYCGLIGSLSKRRRFEHLMRQQNMPAQAMQQLTCPIGVDGIDGKKPEEIAISVAAQLLQLRNAFMTHHSSGLTELEIANGSIHR